MQGRRGTASLIPANPFDARTRSDPYPVYQFMRTVDPIHRSPIGFWVLTRYDDCSSVLQDARWSHDADSILEPARRELDPVDPTVRLLRATVVFADGKRHGTHQRVLEAAVRPAVAGMGSATKKVARQLVKLMRERGDDADIVRDFAVPLPLVALCDMLGIPAGDRPQVMRWSRELAGGLDPAIRAAGVVKAGAAAAGMIEYMLGRLDAARAGSADGLIGRIGAESTKLSTWELVADLAAVLVTGLETSSGFLGNAVLTLLRNEDQLAALRARGAVDDLAFDELLRFDGPLHLTARVAAEDVSLRGTKIAAGEQVIIVLGAANRDPAQFKDPDTLDLQRTENAHLAFGLGSHACFAAPLARRIGAAALDVLLEDGGGMALNGEPEWNSTATMRSLKHLPVSFEA